MFDGLPNLRLPEAPGIRNAPTLRHQPDDADTPPAQFHLPTTPTGRTARSASNHQHQPLAYNSLARIRPARSSDANASADSSTNTSEQHDDGFTHPTRPGVARQSEPRYLSTDEITLLLSKLTDTFRPVAMVCVYAGLRISETLGLTWADVDLSAKTIHVRRQLDDDGTLRNETKSAASTAIVPMLPALERELRAHRVRQASVDLRLVHRDALIFTTATGQPQSRRNALRALHAAGDAAGLNGDNVEPVGLHDLRHSLVALALDSSRSLAEAAVLARHANARVIGQIYAGVSETAKAEDRKQTRRRRVRRVARPRRSDARPILEITPHPCRDRVRRSATVLTAAAARRRPSSRPQLVLRSESITTPARTRRGSARPPTRHDACASKRGLA